MTDYREGGCLCGAVRYRVAWPPLDVAVCHCSHCQKQAGSAFSILAVLQRDALEVAGELQLFEDSSDAGRPVFRKFCSTCGSPVLTDTPMAQEQKIIFLKAGTLDKTDDLQPTTHYWGDSAQKWQHFSPEQRWNATQQTRRAARTVCSGPSGPNTH